MGTRTETEQRSHQSHSHDHDHDHGPTKPGLSRKRLVWLIVGVAGIAGLLAVRGLVGDASVSPLPNQVQDLLTLSFSVIIESLPFVVLGILLSIVVQAWLPDGILMRYLPRNPVLRRLCISMFGVVLPVCECGNVPLSRGLIIKGFTVSESMTLLLAAPIINPITIITTHQAFGFDDGILVARIIGGLAIANIVGWLFSLHPRQFDLLTPKFAAECRRPQGHDHETRVGKSLGIFVRESSVIMPALFIGALVAGAIQTAVPRDVLVQLGSNPLWSILAMMVLAFVIAVCSSVDAFFILPFASTFMPGSIVTFLVFGPIIDIKMLAILRTTFTTKVLVQLTIMVGLLSALLGLVVNYVA